MSIARVGHRSPQPGEPNHDDGPDRPILAESATTRALRTSPTRWASLTGGDRPRPWTRLYARRLLLTDTLIILGAVAFSISLLVPDGEPYLIVDGRRLVSYWVLMPVLVALWLITLNIIDTRSEHIVGHGYTEYARIINGTVATFLTALAVAFFFKAELARSLFLTAAPLGVALLLISRWGWRQWLRRKQLTGAYTHRAVIIGDPSKVSHIAEVIGGSVGTGFQIVGAITKTFKQESTLDGIDVIGDYAHAVAAIDKVGADTLIVASADDLGPRTLRRLGWAMADRDVQWIVAPAMTDIAGPRIHARPVAGLPLVKVDFPTLEGSRRIAKRAVDVAGSALLILLLSPVLLVVALVVRVSSPGPVFYRQERIGRGGRPFGMIKYRSMIQDADDQLATLLDLQGTSDTPLFKVLDDPRITRAGRFLRKYSLDELPQLFNVLAGEMSLVGPRPQRPAEVALYDDVAHRRLLVKPGMSGLWQVSGRSALSWEDALRLDLYYVENWSLAQDIIILLRTFRAVIKPENTAH